MNPAKEHVLNYADTSLPHEYVADHGEVVRCDLERISIANHQVTVSTELTPDERRLVDEAVRATKPREKQCFRNALKLWQYDHRFAYAEGYASLSTHPDLVVEHAWTMLDGEKIVDPTAAFAHHYGVVISSQEILEEDAGANIHSDGIICGRENYDFLAEQGYTR